MRFKKLLCCGLAFALMVVGQTINAQQTNYLSVTDLRAKAEQGDVKAQCYLGLCYTTGHGVMTNGAEAAKWYRKAADQNYPLAQAKLGIIYQMGLGVPTNYVEAVNLFRKAAEQNDAIGQFGLGACYRNGYGIVKDDIEAYKWFFLAARDGDEGHLQVPRILDTVMSSEQIAEGKRRAYDWLKQHEKQ
jgi:TPR repeat protein